MRIYYGIVSKHIDVTSICLEKLTHNNTITIHRGDLDRAMLFTDPLPGIHKLIMIEDNMVTNTYDEYVQIQINILHNTKTILHDNDIKLNGIHSKLKIKHGSLNDELAEQKMAVRYLKGDEKVLEIGGNIGRNSLVIASILEDSNNLVVLESDTIITKQLQENKELNNFHFHIENSALSNRNLIQQGWNTIPSDTLISGYNWVNTISLDKLKIKYNIEFNTLVLDCEGAFYYILIDMPEILNNINLILVENDYTNIDHKKYIDDVLKKNNFSVVYSESGGWGPCYNNFYEVWNRN